MSDAEGCLLDIQVPSGSTRSVFIHDATTTRDICLMLSEWSSAPLDKFGLFLVSSFTPESPEAFSSLPPPTVQRALEDDRLLLQLVKQLDSQKWSIHYLARLITPTLFESKQLKPRMSLFFYHQCCKLLLSGFDVFFHADNLSKLVALGIAAHPNNRASAPDQLPALSILISPKSLPKLSEDDWQKSISQELRDIEEHKVDGGSLQNVTQEEKTKFQKEFCLACVENHFFGMEIWDTTASTDLDLLKNSESSSSSASQPTEIPSAHFINPPKSKEAPQPSRFDIEEGVQVLLGVNKRGVSLICYDPEGTGEEQVDTPTLFCWDLYAIRSWSYSKTTFSWTELETEIEYTVQTDDGYMISGLLMDYALSIVAESGGSEPPCLKFQTLDQLGWKGKVALDEGKATNSLKTREKQQVPKKNQRQRSYEIDDDLTPDEPSKPWHIRRTTSSITIAWDPPTDRGKIIRYEVRYGVRFVFGWHNGPSVSANLAGNTPNCVVSGLEKNTTYVFTTRSMNDKGFWSDWSYQSDAITTKEVDSPDPTHLVVLSHGVAQNEGNMAYFASELKKRHGPDIVTLCTKANASIGSTRDGINIGGHRLALEIVEFSKHNPDVDKISMIGHNIGGLYCRYAAGALYANEMFKLLKPVNFITLATPHFGHGGTLLSDDMAAVLCGETGEQLALKDGDSTGEDPMLTKICHRQFLQALLHFPNRTVYSNAKHDGRVSSKSGSIRLKDLYENVTDAYLKSKCSRKFPNIIIGEEYEKDDASSFDDFDSSAEDNFVASATPTKSRPEGGDGGSSLGLRLGQSDRRTRDMYASLNEVGWRRRDVINYGHDQLIQDPAWWITERTPHNTAVYHVVETFLMSRNTGYGDGENDKMGDDTENGVDTIDGLETIGLHAQSNKTQELEMHKETNLFYFK